MVAWLCLSTAFAGELDGPLAAVMDYRALRLTTGAPRLSDDVYAKVAAGEIVTGLETVEGHKARKAWGVGIVDAPISKYWGAVNDDRAKVEYTKLDHLELLEGEYCGSRRTVFQYLGVTLMTDRWWVVEQLQNSVLSERSGGLIREVTWKSLDDGPARLTEASKELADGGMQIPFTEGAWLLVDVGDGRTLVEYYAWSDPGGAVPARVASAFAAGGIADTIGAMATLANAGPSCSYD